jgi:hypothetical protein
VAKRKGRGRGRPDRKKGRRQGTSVRTDGSGKAVSRRVGGEERAGSRVNIIGQRKVRVQRTRGQMAGC